MRFIKTILMCAVLAGTLHLWGGAAVYGADVPVLRAAEAATPGAAPEEHGVSQKAGEIARPFGFPITNSMVVSWVVALGLIIFARVAMRSPKQIPTGAQNFWE